MSKMISPNTIICYGDSNTYGFDPRSYLGEQYPKEIRWTGIVEMHTTAAVLNYGLNGRCIPHTNSAISLFCEQLQNWQKYDAPISIWMMLGTNDLLQNPSFLAEDIADRMQYFLSQTTSFLKERKLYEQFHFSLIAPVLLQYGAWVEDSHMIRESRRLSAQYKKVADSLGIHFIDMGSEEIPVLFDGVHLSEEGHRNFAEKMLSFL